jgi:outer membrane protein assembly factor BamA
VRRTLFAFFMVATASAQTAVPLRVGKITIEPLDVYSSAEENHGAFYHLANRMHIETRLATIEKFVLFREGDVFDASKLAETERNLRSLAFLKSASVIALDPHDGVVDVLVVTQDAWSIAPETQVGSGGGTTTYGIMLTESNLLGFGRDVELGWNKGVDRSQFQVAYNDPALFVPYLRAHFGYAVTSDGYNRQFNLRRPFFSFSTPTSGELAFNAFRQDDRLYEDGVEVARFSQNHRDIGAGYGFAIRPNDNSANRLSGGLRLVDDDFSTYESRQFRYLYVQFDHSENDYLKLNFVNKDLRYEDFNLGRGFGINAAISPKALGVDSTTGFVGVRGSDGFRFGDNAFVMPSLTFSTRLASGIDNAIANANLLYVNRSGDDHPRTFVAHASVNSGWRMDPELQFFADGLNGLRGYRTHMFAGSRSVVFNVEERFYFGREILQLASPAIVAFIDAGNATNGGFSDLMSLKTDVGFGIRVGLPRTPKNVLRIDFAYALNPDPMGRRGFLVSFSSGQAF